MALIRCPECDTEISDAAEQCPKCGYSLDRLNNFIKEVEPLSPINRNIPSALSWILFGGISVVGGLLILPFGILAIIGGVFLISKGADVAKGAQSGLCPYCHDTISVKVGSSSFKCPMCNNIGNQTDTALESTHPINNQTTQ